MKPTALIFRTDLLPPSETFIPSQAHALRRYAPCFAGLRLVPTGLQMDPCETVVLARDASAREQLRRRMFLATGIGPRFLRALELRRASLLHAHFAVDAAAALPVQRHLQLPLVVTLHGYDATSSDAAHRRTAMGRMFLRRKHELFSRAKLFVCVSEHIRRQALEHGFPAEKLRTLPIGVDLEVFAPNPLQSRSRDPIVLFVGRLVEKKGCDHLIQAMAMVEERHPTSKLLIVGDGPLQESLRMQARKSLKRCTFLGAQPPSVVRDLMHRASLLAATSVVAASGDTEGLPIVLCEAQAIGLPIAAFEGPGVTEAVVSGETALLAPSGDDAALADAMSAILNDNDLAGRLAAAGRKRAEACFSLATQTARLEEIYDELLR
jgi:glycosyltransferase involved in cell wall biosynthesis